MKKRTVITTEKREVWIISDGRDTVGLREADDEPTDGIVSITPASPDGSEATPGEEAVEGN